MNNKILKTAALLGVMLTPVTQAEEIPIDLNTWSQAGVPSNGNWTVADDGESVFQSINGNPTFFVSPDQLFNTTIRGSFGVETPGDDDYIGFVFGLNSPNMDSDPNDMDYWLFDWKQRNQGRASEGFSLNRVDGNITDYDGPFWDHQNTDDFTVMETMFGDDLGWQDNVSYDFELLFQVDRIKIDIMGGDGVFANGMTVFDVSGTFQSGQFGFYNYSQSGVRYMGFTEEETPPDPPPTNVHAPSIFALLGLSIVGLVARRRKFS